MVYSLYWKIIEVKDSFDDVLEVLAKAGIGWGHELESDYGRELAHKMVLYIIYAYCKDSEHLFLSHNWTQNRNTVYQLLGSDERMFEPLVMQNNKRFRQIIGEFLEMQGDQDFKFLKSNEDLYDELYNDFMENRRGDDGKIDFKVVQDKRKMLFDLWNEIQELKERIRDKNMHIYDNLKQIADKEKENSADLSLNIEKSPLVKK